jgi:hypothetical protein
MTDTLTITKTEGRVTILHFKGHLDGQVESMVVEAARQAVEAGAHFLLADLNGVGMITSAGLRALHTVFKMLTRHEEVEAWQKEHPGEVFKSPYFKLAGAASAVFSVLNLAGFLHNIPIYPDLKTVLESFPV